MLLSLIIHNISLKGSGSIGKYQRFRLKLAMKIFLTALGDNNITRFCDIDARSDDGGPGSGPAGEPPPDSAGGAGD